MERHHATRRGRREAGKTLREECREKRTRRAQENECLRTNRRKIETPNSKTSVTPNHYNRISLQPIKSKTVKPDNIPQNYPRRKKSIVQLSLACGTLGSEQRRDQSCAGDREYRKAPHGEMRKTYGKECLLEKTASREQVPEVK
ncbi:hypothetical protein Ddc_18615 [Ditylenchus destructor]|nr:hypothetical protein Ddc_18615 [Ditylenchus destructor]